MMIRKLVTVACLATCMIGCDEPNDLQDPTAVNQVPTLPTTDSTTDEVVPMETADVTDAYATVHAVGESGVTGEIKFTSQGDSVVLVTGQVMGLEPGKHGFHVHEKGDLSDTKKGESVGGHFNPMHTEHGRPEDPKRHAGDFGNITADEKGIAAINFEDTVIQLNGPNSIVGRAIVIHANEDKFTQPSGDAGGRVAFGKIEAGKR